MKNILLILSFYLLQLNFIIAQDSTATIAGPGTIYHKVFKPSVPWNITILEINITNPYLSIKTEIANNALGNGLEKTSAMSLRNDAPGHRVIGAVNGDYFGISAPQNPYTFLANSMIKEQEFVFGRTHQRSSFGMLIGKSPVIEVLNFSGTAAASNDSVFSIFGVNRERGANQLLLYNKFIGATTLTDNSGTEVRLTLIDTISVNNPTKFVVANVYINSGNNSIGNSYVLSGAGSGASFLQNNFSAGDTVVLNLGISPDVGNLISFMGGGPKLINDGVVPNSFVGLEGFGESHVNSRHPRTAIGFSEDSTKIYMVVVDGRQANLSIGMSCKELADYMKSIGCYNAVNLDGGGSSTMVVRNQIANSPSDPGGERSVGNSILLVSTAPLGNLNILHVSPGMPRVFLGGTVTFNVQGTDEYLNPYPLHQDTLMFTLSSSTLGSITSSGVFTAGETADSGSLTISYKSISKTIPLVVKGIADIEIDPKSAVTDFNRIITFKPHLFDTDGVEQQIASNLYTWLSTDTTVGTVDQVGQFRGLKTGSSKIIASFKGVSDTAEAHVQIGTGVAVADSIESIFGWELGGENIDTINSAISFSTAQSTIGSGSLKLDYSFTYQAGEFNWAYLKCSIPLYGLPDSIKIDVFSDGAAHRVFFDFEDAAGAVYRIQTHKLANLANIWDTLKARVPGTSVIVFPLKIKQVAIVLGGGSVSGQNYSGTIYIDNIRVRYPNNPTNIDDADFNPEVFKLYQNYPNPFNPTTKIKFRISNFGFANLKIYDVLGNELAVLVNEEKSPGDYEVVFNASDLSSGVYFYQLRAGNNIQRKKMLLLK